MGWNVLCFDCVNINVLAVQYLYCTIILQDVTPGETWIISVLFLQLHVNL